MHLRIAVFFVTVSLSAANIEIDVSGGQILALVLRCSQPWYEEEVGVCPEACRRWPHYCYYAIAAKYGVPGTCELPLYPRTGGYSITDTELTGALADFTLIYSCPRGYSLHGQNPRCVNGGWTAAFPDCVKAQIFDCRPRGYSLQGQNPRCVNGGWTAAFPDCVKADEKCALPSDPSVKFTCDSPDGKCPENVDSGQRAIPECRRGFIGDMFRAMHCIDGSWDYIATCRSECGTIRSEGIRLRKRDVVRLRGSYEAPWHASVYQKTTTPYKQLCGGSLISPTFVITAAHCFWSDHGKRPAADFAVAAGKIYRPWNNQYHNDEEQKSNISDIQVPPHFRGNANNYQSDIALLTLKTSMVFNDHVRPVCVDFDFLFDERQLQPGNVGKVAAWNLSPTLKVVEMSYVAVDQCFVDLPPNFLTYMTSDKICAGAVNGTALCAGDSGGGLVFPAQERGVQRWYLRGVVSTAPSPRDDPADPCFPGHTAFTHLLKHDAFITKLINNSSDPRRPKITPPSK